MFQKCVHTIPKLKITVQAEIEYISSAVLTKVLLDLIFICAKFMS
jgi:hypothetical protein